MTKEIIKIILPDRVSLLTAKGLLQMFQKTWQTDQLFPGYFDLRRLRVHIPIAFYKEA